MSGLAIIGAGIAGLGLAYHLRKDFKLTIYEKDHRAGGHAHTVDIRENEQELPIDTGFMVFNHATYPELLKLFNQLRVPMKMTDMSFSVQHKSENVEYSGASFDRLFGQRTNLFNIRFWKFLMEIDRFNKEAAETLSDSESLTLSLKQYVEARSYNPDLLNLYLIPMTGALWSAPPEKMLHFPAITLLRFFRNHGLLGAKTQHQWWTVDGGSKVYVQKILDQLPADIQLGCSAVSVKRGNRKVSVVDSHGQTRDYDHVVFACHADQALSLIESPRAEEREILGAFAYQCNDTVLHSDASVMPQEKRCWASWNYRLDSQGSSTHYWMNSLQDLSKNENYFVTLNGSHFIDSRRIHKRMEYHHPLFDLKALQAQQRLPDLNKNSYREQLFFCGSYFGFGFHEDALRSSVELASLLSGRAACL